MNCFEVFLLYSHLESTESVFLLQAIEPRGIWVAPCRVACGMRVASKTGAIPACADPSRRSAFAARSANNIVKGQLLQYSLLLTVR